MPDLNLDLKDPQTRRILLIGGAGVVGIVAFQAIMGQKGQPAAAPAGPQTDGTVEAPPGGEIAPVDEGSALDDLMGALAAELDDIQAGTAEEINALQDYTDQIASGTQGALDDMAAQLSEALSGYGLETLTDPTAEMGYTDVGDLGYDYSLAPDDSGPDLMAPISEPFSRVVPSAGISDLAAGLSKIKTTVRSLDAARPGPIIERKTAGILARPAKTFKVPPLIARAAEVVRPSKPAPVTGLAQQAPAPAPLPTAFHIPFLGAVPLTISKPAAPVRTLTKPPISSFKIPLLGTVKLKKSKSKIKHIPEGI